MIHYVRLERTCLVTQKQYILATLAIQVSQTSFQLTSKLLGMIIELSIAIHVNKLSGIQFKTCLLIYNLKVPCVSGTQTILCFLRRRCRKDAVVCISQGTTWWH